MKASPAPVVSSGVTGAAEAVEDAPAVTDEASSGAHGHDRKAGALFEQPAGLVLGMIGIGRTEGHIEPLG